MSSEKPRKSTHFNPKIYRRFNRDLQDLTDDQLVVHFKNHGQHENRIHNLETMTVRNVHITYFDIDYYIKSNTDIQFETKLDYVADYLDNRLNDNRPIGEKIHNFKEEKKQLFYDILKEERDDMNYLSEEDREKFVIGSCETESANEWGDNSDIENIIKNNDIVLNIGAGYRLDKEKYFSLKNVVNTEIFPYPTTDVVCDGENLPFKDNSVDAIISLAVLEHVKHPWKHAEEMIRVLKPGGIIYVDVPFLQPYHGYPHHYYNMTTAGLQNLFDKKVEIMKHTVEHWETPIFSLTWFLTRYLQFLDEDTRKKFSNMTVQQIVNNGPNGHLDYVKNMDKSKEEIIAAGTTLMAKKL